MSSSAARAAAHPHVVVIGAGPAGLATAYCLAQRRIGYTLLERGPSILAGLRRIDPSMELLSPSAFSRLPGLRRPMECVATARRGRRARGQARTATYWTFADYAALLEEYARHHRIEAIVDTEVVAVRRVEGGFEVDVRRPGGTPETIAASHVVNCAGIVSSPRLPSDFAGVTPRWSWRHSLAVRAEDLAAARRLLVVGGGASAAETLDLWLDVHRPESEAWLALRSRLFAFTNPILGLDIHCWI